MPKKSQILRQGLTIPNARIQEVLSGPNPRVHESQGRALAYDIIVARYFSDPPATLQQLSDRFGYSTRERVRQIEDWALGEISKFDAPDLAAAAPTGSRLRYALESRARKKGIQLAQ